ncbi:helix-turn-helix transcriptional regulator [Tunicatimonas pelagia]|uniref:helix-turn-helix transcriptional regulator n=1 Tax=Tunicatimonas pelagia TaxID=931531 RepID=UPI0026666623|nr:helix-turn-helix transcriptional regulator [Tunicatimonas pelagia]WKN46513.1 helix-turn-helix transcriptional regulator [Tunicatimonas pelagia]
MISTEELTRRLASNIRRYRKVKKITQVVLAAKADTDERYIQSIEAGDRVPGVIIAYRIAQALEISVDTLFEESE